MNDKPFMPEKEMLSDVLSSQKQVTENYNTFANECAGKQLREDAMTLLREEHDIQFDIFEEMHSRGWYMTPAAEQQKINRQNQIRKHRGKPLSPHYFDIFYN